MNALTGAKSLTISVDAMGNTKVEADGFQGGKCVSASEPIEAALAGNPGAGVRTYKESYHETESTAQVQQSRVGF